MEAAASRRALRRQSRRLGHLYFRFISMTSKVKVKGEGAASVGGIAVSPARDREFTLGLCHRSKVKVIFRLK